MNATKLRLLAVGAGIFVITILIYYYYYGVTIPQQNNHTNNAGVDIFETKDIYPTKKGGREWFINMQDPLSDKDFSISSDVPIVKDSKDSLA